MPKTKRSYEIETPYGLLRVERYLTFARFRAKCHVCELWTLNETSTFMHDNKFTCTRCYKDLLSDENEKK